MIIKRNIAVLFLLITIPCMVSPSPRPRDALLVVNHTDGDVFFEVEYLQKPREMGYTSIRTHLTVSGGQGYTSVIF
jgi:hypothetical protein